MKIIKEIAYIGLFSIAIAIAYNFTLPKPLSLIREKKVVAAVDDNLLFANDTIATYTPSNLEKVTETVSKTDSVSLSKDSSISKKKLADSLLATAEIKNNAPIVDKQKVAEAHHNLAKTVTFDQMVKIINNESFVIIDARSPESFATERIGNAINIFPYGDEGEMMNKIMSLPHDKKIVVYCDGGACDASHKIAEIIISFGYDRVFLYSGGWEEWALKYKKAK